MEQHSRSLESQAVELLARYQNYLRVLAETHLGAWLQSRVGASDIVQDTLVDAYRGYERFLGSAEAERLAWLKAILLNNINRAFDLHVSAQKRTVRREVSINRLKRLYQSSVALEEALATAMSTPSESVARHEVLLSVSDCLAELSDDHRQVILLRTMQSKSFVEVAKAMDRSEPAARMLWIRAIAELRKGLARRKLV